MALEDKLKEILKCEIISFSIILLLTLLLIPFMLRYWKTYYAADKPIKYIITITFLVVLVIIIFKKIYIIIKVIWSKKNYDKESSKVYHFLKARRASLITVHGHISYYHLYNEALKIVESFISDDS